MSDSELRPDVSGVPEFEPGLYAACMAVAVDEGIVTLTGHVASFSDGRRRKRW